MPVTKRRRVDGREAFEGCCGARAGKGVLDHVAEVEEGGVGAGEDVGVVDCVGGVLEWHGVGGGGGHFGVVGEVEVVEGRFLEG